MQYQVLYQNIPVVIYQQLRQECGLSAKTLEAAKIGLSNSLCSVTLVKTENNKIIGMGRLIGDGGCHCQISDICVIPAYQGKGLSKLIMQKLDEYIQDNIPESCYINLIADGTAYKLYEQFRFKEVYPASRGMGYCLVKDH